LSTKEIFNLATHRWEIIDVVYITIWYTFMYIIKSISPTLPIIIFPFMPLNFKNEGGGNKLYRELKPKRGKKHRKILFLYLYSTIHQLVILK